MYAYHLLNIKNCYFNAENCGRNSTETSIGLLDHI